MLVQKASRVWSPGRKVVVLMSRFQEAAAAVIVKVQAVAAAGSEQVARSSNEKMIFGAARKAPRSSAQPHKARAAGSSPAPGRSAPGWQHPRCPHHCPCQ